MNSFSRIISAAIYLVLFFILFPWFQYVIDIDAISYIHVAQRFANGEYYYSLNGYWSPLISWILVPFIKLGYDPVLASKFINGFLGLLTMFSCNVLTDKFNISSTIKKIIPFALAILLVSFAFYELCADLLLVFLLTLYLNLVLGKNFINDPIKIIFAALVAGLCYYAKAYSFPFFFMHFTIVAIVTLLKNKPQHFIKTLFIKLMVAFVTFLIITAPYIALISHKYGSFRISNAGMLNTSWFLSPGTGDTSTIVAIPPFGDATSYWDEPTYSQKKIVGPFTSVHYFLVQIKIVISNIFKYLGMLNLMSVFAFVIVIAFAIYLYLKKKASTSNEILLFISAIIYPIGYFMIFIEWRYIWIVPICFLLLAGIVLTFINDNYRLPQKIYLPISLLILLSFVYQPINEMQDLKNNNKDVYEMAEVFKKNHISGNFLLNYKSFPSYGKTVSLCYLTQSKLFGPARLDYTLSEFSDAVNKYRINYYLFFYDFSNEKELFLQSTYAKMGKKIYADLYPGIVVIQF